MGPDIIQAVQEFFKIGNLNPKLNYSFVTLIPKISTPQTPSDFRPISLSNTIYKIISKILANRLKPILNKIISPNQSAFVVRETNHGEHYHRSRAYSFNEKLKSHKRLFRIKIRSL